MDYFWDKIGGGHWMLLIYIITNRKKQRKSRERKLLQNTNKHT